MIADKICNLFDDFKKCFVSDNDYLIPFRTVKEATQFKEISQDFFTAGIKPTYDKINDYIVEDIKIEKPKTIKQRFNNIKKIEEYIIKVAIQNWGIPYSIKELAQILNINYNKLKSWKNRKIDTNLLSLETHDILYSVLSQIKYKPTKTEINMLFNDIDEADTPEDNYSII